jgi:DNA-binding transcriptional regulator/RsmH inhibitor MraZ
VDQGVDQKVEQTSNGAPKAAKPPLGIFQAKCDDKGRLKLPSEIVSYLRSLAVERVFITTVDLKLIRIYSETLWESNQNLFLDAGENAKIAQDVAFIANLFGAHSEIDDNGRVLIPTELRRKLEVEGQPVWMDLYNGRINVFGKKVYDERMHRALDGLEDKVSKLEVAGFK